MRGFAAALHPKATIPRSMASPRTPADIDAYEAKIPQKQPWAA